MKKTLLVTGLVLALGAPALAGNVAYWGSARGVGAAPPHQIHGFDSNGVLVLSLDQVAGAQTSSWGYRDGATDPRDGTIYFGWENGLASHDADGGNGTQIVAGAAPGGVGTWRALHFDVNGNGGAGSLWVANFASAIAEVALDGTLLNTLAAGNWSLYGLAAKEGSPREMYGHTTGGEVIVINKDTGAVASAFPTGFGNLAAQGGLSALRDGTDRLAAVSQGTPDELGVYNPNGTFSGGPWDMEGQTGSNGHLGVAVVVIPGPGALALLGLAGLIGRRRRA